MATTTMEEDDLQTLIAEQRRELMAAKSIDSDIDFAYNLQLQEAITASLQSQPSSSSSTTLPPFTHQEEPPTNITDIMLREIDKYEQERRDYEQSKAEFNILKQNLSVRLHDHKFASRIARVSEDEWRLHGDNYEQPYCVSSSSSLSSVDDQLLGSECFRMYFKGVLGDDEDGGGGGGGVKLAAIGVAICDERDNMIFEISKAVMEEGRGEMSAESVEFEALIAGLTAALGLDLKRVEYFCDNFMFYQAVIGRHQPTECRVANFIERVNLLHTRFRHCVPRLVARSDIKFAFRLAKASISSQLIRSVNSSSKNGVKETCSICYEDRSAKLMFAVDGCGHRYCSLCMEQHLEVKLLHGSLPKCPHADCKSGINIDSCTKLLAPNLLDIMSQRMKEATIPAADKVYCPNPSCSTLMSMSEVKEYSKAVVRYEELGASRCIKCHQLFCVECKDLWHSDVTCHEYQHIQVNSNNLDTKLKSLATKKRWLQCWQCKNMIELAEGCYHITCRCGYEFCYICGAEWKNKKATCNCRLWDERNIIRNTNRRQQRRA